MSLAVRRSGDSSRLATYGFAVTGGSPVDVHREKISTREIKTFVANVTNGQAQALDAYFWLPAAAEQYDLSRNLKDYVIVPNVPIILSDVPNTNGVAFPREELLKFRAAAGRLAYHTFKGKPCFVEHQNSDVSKACGVILDCYVAPITGYGKSLVKVVELLAFDRYKNSALAEDILARRKNCYSMGAYFGSFYMSDGSPATQARTKEPLTVNAKDELVYKCVQDIEGFETSAVENPAYAAATNDIVLTL